MTEQEIFAAKAKDGYTVCYAEQCPVFLTKTFALTSFLVDIRAKVIIVPYVYGNVVT